MLPVGVHRDDDLGAVAPRDLEAGPESTPLALVDRMLDDDRVVVPGDPCRVVLGAVRDDDGTDRAPVYRPRQRLEDAADRPRLVVGRDHDVDGRRVRVAPSRRLLDGEPAGEIAHPRPVVVDHRDSVQEERQEHDVGGDLDGPERLAHVQQVREDDEHVGDDTDGEDSERD